MTTIRYTWDQSVGKYIYETNNMLKDEKFFVETSDDPIFVNILDCIDFKGFKCM